MTRFAAASALNAPLDETASPFGESLADPVRRRWIAALALMAAVASAFLVGSLYAVMDRSIHFAAPPPPFRWDDLAKAGVASLREDRLRPEEGAASRFRDSVRVEQLNSSGLAMRPFTHLVADLADLRPPPTNVRTAASLIGGSDSPAPDSRLPPMAEKTALRMKSGEPTADRAPIGLPINVTPIPETEPSPPPKSRVIIARAGDALASILSALGATPATAADVQALYVGSGASPSFAGGERIVVESSGSVSPGASAEPLKIEIDRAGGAPWTAAREDSGRYALCARARREGPAASSHSTVADSLESGSDQTVRDSLEALAGARGVDQSLVDQIVRLAAHDFDLGTPVSSSDRVEFLSTQGKSGPELRYVRLTVGGAAREYYRFTAPDDGSVDYYDRQGRSVTKFLLRKPVPAGRLGDGFGWRIHPILKVRKFHEGVDYDAPMGSPVEAAGAGVVEKISQESGYGRYIRIRHDLGYETTYAHVSGFARGLKVGSRVRQGEVIAYVGSTGLSTGPHLYYEVRINGRNVDPLRIRLADGRILKGTVLADFESRRLRTDQLIAASPISSSRLAAR